MAKNNMYAVYYKGTNGQKVDVGTGIASNPRSAIAEVKRTAAGKRAKGKKLSAELVR